MSSRPFIGSRAEGLCLVLFTACTWGLTWPQSKFLLTMLPPFTMRAACGLAGGAFAFALAAAKREKLPQAAAAERLTPQNHMRMGDAMPVRAERVEAQLRQAAAQGEAARRAAAAKRGKEY